MYQFLSCLRIDFYYYIASVSFCLVRKFGSYFPFFQAHFWILCDNGVLYIICRHFCVILCIFSLGFRGLCMFVSNLSPILFLMLFVRVSASWLLPVSICTLPSLRVLIDLIPTFIAVEFICDFSNFYCVCYLVVPGSNY